NARDFVARARAFLSSAFPAECLAELAACQPRLRGFVELPKALGERHALVEVGARRTRIAAHRRDEPALAQRMRQVVAKRPRLGQRLSAHAPGALQNLATALGVPRRYLGGLGA